MSDNIIGSLNPRIRKAKIGIKEIREINIYPLSVRDQIATKSLVIQGLTLMFEGVENESELENDKFISKLMLLLETNIETIMKMITDTNDLDDVLTEIDNEQFIEIVKIVYEVNYSFLAKTVGDLLNKMKDTYPNLTNPPKIEQKPLIEQSQKSVTIMDTNQEISTD